jgi:plastocyanin
MPETTFIPKATVTTVVQVKKMEATPKPTEAQAAKPKNRNMILIGIVIIVLIVVGVGAFELLNTGGGGPKGTQITMFDNGCSPANPPVCGFKDANGSNSTNITSGNGVYWTNNGKLPHTATSCDSTNAATYSYTCPQSNGSLQSFDLSAPTQGSSTNSVTLTAKGTYYYFCRIHPFMHGAVVVQ